MLQTAPSLAGDTGKPPTPPPPTKQPEPSLLSFADGRVVFDLEERVRFEWRDNRHPGKANPLKLKGLVVSVSKLKEVLFSE
ncbi:MAG: hypothetical protein H0U43_01745 [Chthoniobacterales bacterium]|nr:hypothetical protein [Chthoniobacterales bacterium]